MYDGRVRLHRAPSGVSNRPGKRKSASFDEMPATRRDARVEGLEQTGIEQGNCHLANIIVRGRMG
jgi:hypothetical protein